MRRKPRNVKWENPLIIISYFFFIFCSDLNNVCQVRFFPLDALQLLSVMELSMPLQTAGSFNFLLHSLKAESKRNKRRIKLRDWNCCACAQHGPSQNNQAIKRTLSCLALKIGIDVKFQLFMYETGHNVFETIISTVATSIGANKVERTKS